MTPLPDTPLPDRARVVVVGGGVVGCSVAYHLTQRGWADVLLLEQNQLTSGTTWHAAGLVTQARPTWGTREVVRRSLEVFRGLEARTGLSTGYIECGTLHLAASEDRWRELRHQATASVANGIEIEILDAAATVERLPILEKNGIVGSLFYPREGRATATDTTMSLAKGAKQGGATVRVGVRVTGVLRQGVTVTGVRTDLGDVEAEYVVNCTGMWGRQFGALAGVDLPLQALAHSYIVTDEIPGLPTGMPTLKSADDWSYVKDEAGALMVGFFEPGSYAWSTRGIPDTASFIRLPEEWEHLGPFYEQMVQRIPLLEDAPIRLNFTGPESFTPDGLYHLGPVPKVRNYYVAAGFNSVGLLSGPGAGSVLADWIVDGRSPVDMPEVDPARVQSHETNRRFLEARVVETLDRAYSVHWPFEQRATARPLRRSQLYAETAAAGAVFGEMMGWERPNWYALPDDDTADTETWGRPGWFARSAEEHRAVREGVGMLDISTYGKLLVQGRDALALLQRLSANDVDTEIGRITYTQWLNQHGGIEADLTVTRTGEDEFLVLTAPATTQRDLARLRAHLDAVEFATVADISGTMAMVAVMGPHSRAVLQKLTDADLGHEAFPFGSSQVIDLGMGFVRATRITYVGELGWELLVPYDLAGHVWETVLAAGASHGIRPVGYHALGSLRLEKAYRSWGHDVSAGDTPLEAGLGFTVAWDKPGGFLGLEALAAQREAGVDRRLVQVVLDDPAPMLLHDEPILVEGQVVGRIASAGYGHTLGRAVGLGYVQAPSQDAQRSWFERDVEIEIASERYPARASLRPAYDPTSARIRS